MLLTSTQLSEYATQGYLVLPECFAPDECAVLRAATEELMERPELPGRVMEKDGRTVRALHGCQRDSAVLDALTRVSRLVRPSMQMVGEPVYVYQFKINTKLAFAGDAWSWHQDYIYWKTQDGLPAPLVANVAIFLDDVTEFNGPLTVVPGSHRAGLVGEPAATTGGGEEWTRHFGAELPYTLGRDTVARLVAAGGLAAPKGRAGTALFFHPYIVHASASNLSPFDRRMVIVSYNAVSNLPTNTTNPRPPFIVCRDTSSIVPIGDEALLAAAAGSAAT